MTTLNELALLNLQAENERAHGRLLALGQQLIQTQHSNNEKIESLCQRAAGDVKQLTEVLDSFIRLVLDDGRASEFEKAGLIKHLNSFLNRDNPDVEI